MRRSLLQTTRQSVSRFGTSRNRNGRPHPEHRRLVCEPLEERTLLDAASLNPHGLPGDDPDHGYLETFAQSSDDYNYSPDSDDYTILAATPLLEGRIGVSRESWSESTYNEAVAYLELLGATVVDYADISTVSVNDVDALFLPTPRRPYETHELGAIEAFYGSGGGLFVLDDWGDAPDNWNAASEQLLELLRFQDGGNPTGGTPLDAQVVLRHPVIDGLGGFVQTVGLDGQGYDYFVNLPQYVLPLAVDPSDRPVLVAVPGGMPEATFGPALAIGDLNCFEEAGEGDRTWADNPALWVNAWAWLLGGGPSVGIEAPRQSGSILAGDALRFSGRVWGDVHVQTQWDFGDGRTSDRLTPGIVTYPNPGTYEVTFRTVDDQGQPGAGSDTRTIEVLADPGSVPDMQVVQLDLPDNFEVGLPGTISYSVENVGDGSVASVDWIDAIYLSEDPFLGLSDRLLATIDVAEDLQPGEVYTQTLDVVVPVTAERAYYLLVSADDEWAVLERHQLNNELAASTDVVYPRLEDEVPRSAALVGSGASHYYRVDVPSGSNLRITLDDADDLGVNELYARFGEPPTRGNYDYHGTAMASADQDILIPAAYSGAWYVLVYAESAVGTGEYTIEADIVGLELTDVTPDHHGAGADAVLTLTGAGFDSTTTVELVAPDDTAYAADLVELDSFTQMTVTFAAGSVPAGSYSVCVSQTDGDSDELTDAFQMIAGGEAVLETNLVLPSSFGYHIPATIYVEYANTGDLAMPAPLLVLQVTQEGREAAILTLDQSLQGKGYWSSAMPEGFSNTIQFLASGETPGVLQPGESFRVPIYWAGWQKPWDFSYPAFDFDLGYLAVDDTTPVDWDTLKPQMQPDTISEEAWDPIWENFVAQVGTTWGDYLSMLDENAAYLGRLGQQVLDVSQLLGFEFMQADCLAPGSYLASGIDAWAESPGLPLTFGRTFPQTISQRYESGPLGRGWSHNWDFSLDVADDGTVTITGPGATRRVFLPDIRGGYFSQAGDYATLTDLGGGAFSVQEQGGLLTVFHADGKLDYVEDTNGNRITAGYTGEQLTSLTHSAGAMLLLEYDAQGMIANVTDPLGPGAGDDRVTTYSYDTAGEHLESVQRHDELAPTYYEYITGQGAATEHAISQIEYPGSTHAYFTYDGNGRLYEVFRDGQAEKVTFTYGSSGKVSATDATGGTTDFFFDHRGLQVKVEDPLDNPVYFTFDNQYNLLEITGPTGLSTSYNYDPQGNLIRSIDALGNPTSFAYSGPYNRLTKLADANGNTTRYGHDAQGNQTSITYADLTQEQVGYDAVGNPTEWTNRRGAAVGYTYDDLGRLTRKDYQDGSHVEFTYDNHGNVVTATDPTGTTTLDYDSTTDRLQRITYPGDRWLEFTYDTVGRRTSSLDQLGHRLDYHYDAVGRLERITDTAGAQIVRYHYDVAGRLEHKDLDNGVYTTYQYDAAGQLLQLDNYAPDDSELSHFHYTYDMLGRRTSMDTHYGLWTYEYDDIGQLTHAVLDSTDPQIPDQDITYVYDALGNRISTIVNGKTAEYTTNNMNQYTQVGDITYEFDADGNLVREISPEGTTTYTYDDENRLIAVSSPEGDWDYVYDAFGNRVAATENGQTTQYVIDPTGLGNVVGEYNGSGDLIAHYDHGFSLVSRIDAVGVLSYYTFDAIGSTSELTNLAGLASNTYAYTPFGESMLGLEVISNSFEFVGAFGVMNESNGLEFMRARFYHSELGRFVSEDPLRLFSGDSNAYRYALNRPGNMIDPSGLQSAYDLEETQRRADIAQGGGLPSLLLYHYRDEIESALNSVGDWIIRIGEPTERFFCAFGDWAAKWIGRPFEWLSDKVIHIITPKIPPTKPSNSEEDVENIASEDPNEKTGPGGYDDAGYIVEDTLLSYRVDFENDATATAPAQVVAVTDRLDSDLDWTTFELMEIGFGDQLLAVPAGSQHFETTVPMSYEGVDFEVQIEAGIRSGTGEVFANFYSIDPDTGLPPDVTIGFLPPEDDTGRGMGHFNYIIRPKNDLPTGTEIRNIAIIQFDFGEIIATNQVDPHDPSQGTDPAKECLNTIDAGIPEDASHVEPLPAETQGDSVLVCWTGEDEQGGSGIGSYDVYYRVDNDPYELWLDDTADSSATFTGETGHTYAFYSIATDNVGHREAAPETPDAQTILVPTNQPPVANDDSFYTVAKGGTLTTTDTDGKITPGNQSDDGVLVNDTDVDGDPLTAVLLSHPIHGTVTSSDNGTFTYQHDGSENSTDSFTYKSNDGTGDSNVATVSINITVGTTSSLSGFVYADTNNDGTFDEWERGLPGVKMTRSGEGVNKEAWTDKYGRYEFTGLGAGMYQISEVQPEAFLDGEETVGKVNGVSSGRANNPGNSIDNIVLGANEEGVDYNFGERGLLPGFISLRLFLASTPPPEEYVPFLMSRECEFNGEPEQAEKVLKDADLYGKKAKLARLDRVWGEQPFKKDAGISPAWGGFLEGEGTGDDDTEDDNQAVDLLLKTGAWLNP